MLNIKTHFSSAKGDVEDARKQYLKLKTDNNVKAVSLIRKLTLQLTQECHYLLGIANMIFYNYKNWILRKRIY